MQISLMSTFAEKLLGLKAIYAKHAYILLSQRKTDRVFFAREMLPTFRDCDRIARIWVTITAIFFYGTKL